MSTPYARAPHVESPSKSPTQAAPNAALLIDFDNVTMGMRSDLSDELKNLLNSDIIKGKVAVQRAYADWRRYPQYIVPLSEASIDLIFAPAYGSNKKNATDIRMAIDALELIFVRPEIGTFILLTGDSDFSSLVLKLKEYGKYVIGVGIQESSSDILVQNCDEYYSYTSLAGLRKTTEADTEPVDPWLLVEKALERMESRNDVMRSDRLKQVMMEIDAGFDESEYGFSKFSRFLTEASSKDLVELKKLDNGQYEVHPTASTGDGRGGRSRGSGSGGGGGRSSSPSSSKKSSGGRSTRSRGRATRSRSRKPSGGGRASADADRKREETEKKEPEEKASPDAGGDPLQEAYDLLQKAIRVLTDERDVPAIRDSDVKRRMLSFDGGFDEAELGFSKFSLFLQQADEHDVIELRTRDSGNYEVSLPGRRKVEDEAPTGGRDEGSEPTTDRPERPSRKTRKPQAEKEGPEAEEEPASDPETPEPRGRVLGPRGGEKRSGRRKKKGPPPILEGQVVGSSRGRESTDVGDETASDASTDGGSTGAPPETPARTPAARGGGVVDPDDLGLPTDGPSIVRYLANSYKGVGEKTAEAVVDAVGGDVFRVLQEDPDRVRDAIPSNRADKLLGAWEKDLRRRRERLEEAGVDLTPPENGGGDAGGPDEDAEATGTGASSAAESTANEEASGSSAASPEAEADEDTPESGEAAGEQPPRTRLGRRRSTRR